MAEVQTSASRWLQRWDAQQQMHIPEREDRFNAITAALAAYAGERPKVLDLGCGPGSLSMRVLQRLPGAQIVAIDTDPVLLAIGRRALAEERVHFVDADLRGDWTASLPLSPPFDAAVSTTALHWLQLAELLPFYRRLAGVLRPGAVLLDGDRFDFGHDQSAIGRTARAAQPSWPPVPPGAEDWDAWWAAVETDPEFRGEVELRRARHHEHPHDHEAHTYEFHRATLLAAGFTEVGTIWQRLVDRVLIAIR
ncbi:MAG TPA: class I SAM-dependent methyltransferase [Candidatus Dormibacteraeota bacterium]